MKKKLLTCALIALQTLPLFSQETVATTVKEEPDNKSSVSFSGSPYDFIFSWKKKATESHWTGLGFAFSNLNGLGDVDLDLSHSYSVILNVVDYIVPLHPNWLITTGVGFDWSRYHFRGNRSLLADGGKTHFYTDNEPGREYRDSRLLLYYASIPLVFEYQTKTSNGQTFFVYGGVEGLVKLYSKSQAKIQTPEGIKKETYNGLHLVPLNFRFTARIGFRDFSLFGYYQPLSIFGKGKGPDIHPYGLGLMWMF
ncbi:MAG: PorT family protein [Dysgonamonadaceae bacterium]|jgi:hypothetical protein|nr:PorT family protein [Dysgonamonadaceae bacterium]